MSGWAQEMALQMYGHSETCTVSIMEFWIDLGGKKSHEKNADFMNFSRLFKCSNDKGYFCISEKCSDFCQEDLVDEDIMILDNGNQIFIWVGTKCSDVEIKLAYKSAQVYLQNMRSKQPERPRQMMLTFKGKESKRFTKCFHGWTKHVTLTDPRDTYLSLHQFED